MRSPMNLVGTAVFTAVFIGLSAQAVRIATDAPATADKADTELMAAALVDRLVTGRGSGWWKDVPDCDGWDGLDPRGLADLGLAEERDCMARWAPGAANVLSFAKVLALGAPTRGSPTPPLDYGRAREILGLHGVDVHVHINEVRNEPAGTPLVVDFGPDAPASSDVGSRSRLATYWNQASGPTELRVTVEAWPA